MKRKHNSSQKVTDLVFGVWLGWQGYPLVSGWVKKNHPFQHSNEIQNTFIYATRSIDIITPWLSQNGYRVGASVKQALLGVFHILYKSLSPTQFIICDEVKSILFMISLGLNLNHHHINILNPLLFNLNISYISVMRENTPPLTSPLQNCCSWVRPRCGAELYIFEITSIMYTCTSSKPSIYLINHKCKQAQTRPT